MLITALCICLVVICRPIWRELGGGSGFVRVRHRRSQVNGLQRGRKQAKVTSHPVRHIASCKIADNFKFISCNISPEAPVTMSNGLSCGEIQVIFGPMFSGKTTELIRRMKRYQIAKYRCLIVRYSKDNRYSTSGIATHDKQELPALSGETLSAIIHMTNDVNVIGIDEGQFFPDCVEFAEKMANAGKIVIVAALDGTFQRAGFGDILRLIPLAESVVKLKAVCMACFNDASFTKRTTSERELEIIGGEDKYMAVCRGCHRSPSTLTPSKFPLSEVTNSSFTNQPVKVKRNITDALTENRMDFEN